jgi:hypothetical protein
MTLHLAGRRVPTALIGLVGCAVMLRVVLGLGWSAGTAVQTLVVVIEAGAAVIIAVTTHSPFGEPERVAGRLLPWLRLGGTLALTGVAVAMLAAGSAAARLPGGDLAAFRNVAGLVGIGLLSATIVGGGLAWIGPMAYLAAAEFALTSAASPVWIWPARPPHDNGATLCAVAVFAAGTLATAIRGARDSADR